MRWNKARGGWGGMRSSRKRDRHVRRRNGGSNDGLGRAGIVRDSVVASWEHGDYGEIMGK